MTASLRSAFERQIAEVVKIEIKSRKGVKLLNSKSEFNRCEIPRLTVSNNQAVKEFQEEQEEKKRLKNSLKTLRKRKKDEKVERER